MEFFLKLLKSLLNSLSSVKLAIFLLIFITAASVLGTLIPQQRNTAEYVAQFGQLAQVFIRFQITNLYHSGWFIALLYLFSLNIFVCTLTRFLPRLRRAVRPRLITDKKNILLLKINDSFGKNWRLAKSQEEFKKELSSRHYRLKAELKENRAFFSARKRTLGLFGSDLVHLGLLLVLAGGIISGSGGTREYLTLNEGQILPVLNADFKIRLDKFETEYHPNGRIKDWKSTLTVLENEKSILSKVVEVNHPLSYKGYVFYQSERGWDWSNPSFEIWIKKKKEPSFLKKKEIKIGENALIEGENIRLSALNFVPDFVRYDNKQVATRSLDPNNPAVLIEGWQEEEKIFSGWIFAKFPDFSQIHFVKEADFSFELRNFKGTPFSGIQASKDPGVNFIWLGCAVGLIGLSLAFYWQPREIKVYLEESQGKTEVVAGGIVSKNRESFQLEFEKIMTSLRRTK